MKLGKHKDQIKDKLERYEKAEQCVKTLHKIDDKISKYLVDHCCTIETVNTLSKWHSECTKFIEEAKGFTFKSAEIPGLLELVMDPVLLINEYVNNISAKVQDSVFAPSVTLSSDFFDVGTMTTYIIEKYDKYPYYFSCIHKIGELFLRIDCSKFEINWNEYFIAWKRICEIELSMLNTYMSNITIDDIYDDNNLHYYDNWTELWPMAEVSCQSIDTEEYFYTGAIFNIKGNPYIFTGILRKEFWGEDGIEYFYHAIFRCDAIDDEKIICIEEIIEDPEHPFFIGEHTNTIVTKLNINTKEVN